MRAHAIICSSSYLSWGFPESRGPPVVIVSWAGVPVGYRWATGGLLVGCSASPEHACSAPPCILPHGEPATPAVHDSLHLLTLRLTLPLLLCSQSALLSSPTFPRLLFTVAAAANFI